MATGQILFKYIALDLGSANSLRDAVFSLPVTPGFWGVGFLYGTSMIYWIWLLSQVPLSIAYPFSALSLLIVPIFSYFLFSEPLTIKYFVGIMLIMFGISLVSR
jgi:multidrug transporter EmrE-like cation transporter